MNTGSQINNNNNSSNNNINKKQESELISDEYMNKLVMNA